jgi:uncharacterized membrane protein required for colicin V production
MNVPVKPYHRLPAILILAAIPTSPAPKLESMYGWFDLVVVAVLLAGILRGRKRGMSQELLGLLQWLSIVIGGAFLYNPIGSELASVSGMNLTYCFVVAYLGFALFLKLVFTWLRRHLGEKLVGSDVFGRGEYYLGMIAGAIRFGCVLVMVIAVMHAPRVTEAERRTMAKRQQENFGDISFPTFGSIQYGIFHKSFVGQWIKNEASLLLVTSDAEPDQKREGIGQQRQREIDSIFTR